VNYTAGDKVTVAYLPNENMYPILDDGWGDPAVVLDVQACAEHDDCQALTVSPDDENTTLRVHTNGRITL